MTLSFLRPAILAALTLAGLAGCGGKADYPIAGTVFGLEHPGLVLTETISGQTITLNGPNTTTFAFPNSIEYGTEYNVVIPVTATSNGQPLHQTCGIDGRTSTDSAGRRASINVLVSCAINQFPVGGTITMATATTTGSFTGLKLINGSNDATPITITAPVAPAVAAYSYAGIPYNTPYGITIFAQPTDQSVKCELKAAVPKASDTADKVAGTVGDAPVVINVVCKNVPLPTPTP